MLLGGTNAAGTGGVTDGGVAVLLAVPWRMDRYIFFPDVKSTSPNFYPVHLVMSSIEEF